VFSKIKQYSKTNSFLYENVPIYTSINDLEVVNILEEMNKILIEIESDNDTILTTSPEQEEVSFEGDNLNNQEEVFDKYIFD
jgi:hypothetical protein